MFQASHFQQDISFNELASQLSTDLSTDPECCASGEDRWLCTLMLQQGYRVEYSAASDAFTFAPEGFNEFYNQARVEDGLSHAAASYLVP